MGVHPLSQRYHIACFSRPISAKVINVPLLSFIFYVTPNLGFSFPYFDHDAFTHHGLHVLDASARVEYS